MWFRLILSWKQSDREGCRSLWLARAAARWEINCFFTYIYFFTSENHNLLLMLILLNADLQGSQQNPEQQKAQDDAKRLVYKFRFLVLLSLAYFSSWLHWFNLRNMFIIFIYMFFFFVLGIGVNQLLIWMEKQLI